MSTETLTADPQQVDAHRIKTYEAMFLLSQGEAAALGEFIDHLNEIFAKHDIEVLAMKKWDERRLAYEIDKQKRGVFILCYLRCHTSALQKLEREVNLSERIMRLLITKGDHLTVEEMQAADAREDLQVEAKLRAEKAAAGEEERRQTVSIGAPKQEQLEANPAAAPAPEGAAAAPATDAPAPADAPAPTPAEAEAPKAEDPPSA
ncbi:MAG: 30S ribosomal protein S6 [Planctomycetota bacterium]